METTKRASLKEIFGWCMFDFANSAYTTVIISVVFGDVFSRIIVPAKGPEGNPYQYGNALWGIALAISYIAVVLTGPIFGAITDYCAAKKKFLFASYILCVFTTFALFWVEGSSSYWLAFALIVLSNFGFASGENFASSFLPYLGTREELGKISGYAWGVGYFGGIASVILVNTLGEVKLENYENLRLVGPYTALFFLIAAIPTFLFLKEYTHSRGHHPWTSYIDIGYHRVTSTIKSIRHFKDMGVYLVSLFFAMAALAIVISFAFIYGAQEIHLENKHRAIMFVLIQIFAAVGAIVFGYIQDKVGAKKTFNWTLVLWILCLLMIYWVKDLAIWLNSVGVSISVQWLFVSVSILAGTGLGSTQSASRAIVGVFAPNTKSGEFFGLWGLSGKIASAFGLFAIAGLQYLFNLRDSFLVISIFFFVALMINLLVNEERGIEAAKNYQEAS